MKVLLINPAGTEQEGFTNPPLGLMYLASAAERAGAECDIADGCIIGEAGVEQALENPYDIIGVTCLTPGRWRAFDTALKAKQAQPQAKIVLGGVHPTILPEQVKSLPWVDYVVAGDGEGPIADLVQGREPVMRVLPVDENPVPAYHKVPLWKYPARGRHKIDFGKVNGIRLGTTPRVSVVFSRGCPAHCNFCSAWWVAGKYRVRDPKLMADELELLVSMGHRHFAFADDVFSVDREKTLALCREIANRGLRIAFHVTTRTDCVDKELCEAMKEAGCYGVSFGIESGDQEVLRKIHKSVNLEVQAEGIRIANKAGLHTTALVIVGNIGESIESVRATRDFLKAARPASVGAVGGLWIFPGTAVYQSAKRSGVINDWFWFTRKPFLTYHVEHDAKTLAQFQDIVWAYSWKSFLRRKIRLVFSRLLSWLQLSWAVRLLGSGRIASISSGT